MATILLRTGQDLSGRFLSTLMYSLLFLFTLFVTSCQPPKPSAQEITLEATPLGQEIGTWKVISSEELTLSICAKRSVKTGSRKSMMQP